MLRVWLACLGACLPTLAMGAAGGEADCGEGGAAVSSYRNPLEFSYSYFTGSAGETKREIRDPCIIREGDTYYLVFTMWPFRYIQKSDLSGLPRGVIKRVGEERKIVSCSKNDIGMKSSPEYLEGPWMEKLNGKYIVFFAALYGKNSLPEDRGYWVGTAVGDSAMGPFKKDPRGKVFHGGHVAVFDGPDGRKWFSYRWEKDARFRGLLCVDPLDVDKDGRIQADCTAGAEVRVPLRQPAGSNDSR